MSTPVDDFLRCQVCGEEYDTEVRVPKFLRCHQKTPHTLCLVCAHHLADEQGDQITCPFCQDLTAVDGSVDQLDTNIYVVAFLEKMSQREPQTGPKLFCQTCGVLASNRCDDHVLLKMSELKERLQTTAAKGAEILDKVREKRTVVVTALQRAADILASAALVVQQRLEAEEMELQFEDSLLAELERTRETAGQLQPSQLADTYSRVVRDAEHHVDVLKTTAVRARHCHKLLKATANIDIPDCDISSSYTIGTAFDDNDVSNALIAAAIINRFMEEVKFPASKSNGVAATKSGSITANGVVKKSADDLGGKRSAPVSFSGAVKSGASPPQPAASTAAVPAPGRPPRNKYPLYFMEIRQGDITHEMIIELRPDLAPRMCKNFMLLCDEGHYNDTGFHHAIRDDQISGGKIGDEDGFARLPDPNSKYFISELCPLRDECGAIRMKGMGTTVVNGTKRGLVGSQFMIWVSETREYKEYEHTLVFGYLRQGLSFVRNLTRLPRHRLAQDVRIIAAGRKQ